MEDEFWECVRDMAKEQGLSIAAFVALIDEERGTDHNLSSALRLAVLKWWQEKAAKPEF